MQKKLRRSLFIGLGGTGLASILQTKKRIIETYGEVPPMFGFLAIDTDENAFNKTLTSKFEDRIISLDASEKCFLSVPNPQAIFIEHPDLFSWMPAENVNAMTSIRFGAGQVRTTGRFAAFCNYDKLYQIISSKIDEICSKDIIGNTKYSIANNNVEIHLAFSLGGGTGSGIFIDTAYIIKNLLGNRYAHLDCKMFGYAILPDVFATMGGGGAGMARVRPNGYGALVDVDFLMDLTPVSNPPVEINYGEGNLVNTKNINGSKPFDVLMLIDNKDQSNNIYDNVSDLAELVSLSLTMGGSEVSADMQSVMDNVVVNINNGMMDVDNKKAWASGLGICEIYFDGNKLGNIYAEKVIYRLINEGLLNSCGDNNNKVNAWIDSPTVSIRENNGKDDIINKLLNPTPNVQFIDIQNTSNPAPEIDQYLTTNQVKVDTKNLASTVESLINNTKSELKQFLIKEVNQECGVGNVIEILNGLKSQIDIFKGELKEESEQFSNKIENFKLQRKAAESELIQLSSKSSLFMLNKTSKINGVKQTLSAITNEYAKALREKERREYALQFYNSVVTGLDDHLNSFNNLYTLLNDIATNALSKAGNIQNNVNTRKAFVVELQDEFAKNIQINDIDIKVAQFVEKLDGNKVFDFMAMNSDLIRDKFWKYAKELKSSLAWRNKPIESVLADLSKEKLDSIIIQAIEKSQPLFSFDYQGLVMGKQIETSFFVGLADKSNSILVKDDYFKKFIPGNQVVNFTTTGIHDRIIIYRQIASVPAFAIVGVKGLEKEFKEKSRNHNFHIDKNWETRMDRENFSLYPDRGRDSSLELWVKGILFGFIKNEDDYYSIKSEGESPFKGDPLDDYWYQLGSGEFRDDCFKLFKSNIRSFENELTVKLAEKQLAMGKEELAHLMGDINSKNYVEKYSKLGMDLSKLKNDPKKYNGVLAQLRDEIEYVSKDLKK